MSKLARLWRAYSAAWLARLREGWSWASPGSMKSHPGLRADWTAEEAQILTGIADGSAPGYRFPPKLERSFQLHVRESSQMARVSVALVTFAFYALAPLWLPFVIAMPDAVRNLTDLIELGLMAPLFAVTTYFQWRYVRTDPAEILLIAASLLEVICVEVLRLYTADHGVIVAKAISVIIPVAVITLARLPIRRCFGFVAGYFLLLITLQQLWPRSEGAQQATHWLLEILILGVALLSAIWSKLTYRRQWAGMLMLQSLAYRDSLTGLPNRRAFEDHYELAIRAIARGQHKRAVLALLDLDHFKKLNDQYGHAYGDGTLAEVALTLSQFTRRALDMAARLGGEEFVLLLYDCDAESARLRIQTLVRTIHDLQIENKGNAEGGGVLTCSIGAVVVGPNKPLSDAYRMADELLYRVKHAGRNNFAMLDDTLNDPTTVLLNSG